MGMAMEAALVRRENNGHTQTRKVKGSEAIVFTSDLECAGAQCGVPHCFTTS